MVSLSDKNPLDVHLQEASQPYVGRWNHLVSTTNWEKGRIITQWRQSLKDENASPAEYSDEAWSRLVGGVTGQHVGRLRRVYDRFSGAYKKYSTLYWSHFYASLDWEDADEWLEKATSHEWSVSQLRRNRWEVLGGGEEPKETDVVAGELDEDFEPALKQSPAAREARGKVAEATAPDDADDSGDDDMQEAELQYAAEDDQPAPKKTPDADKPAAPFQDLSELPDDLTEAFEAFKLAILRHKSLKWNEVALEDVLASLDALKVLAQTPSKS